jgi:hypothetical protein
MSAMDERRQEINKKRWERWRAQQNKRGRRVIFTVGVNGVIIVVVPTKPPVLHLL